MAILSIQCNNNIIINDALHSAGQGSSVSSSANILYSHRLQNEAMYITKQNVLLMTLMWRLLLLLVLYV